MAPSPTFRSFEIQEGGSLQGFAGAPNGRRREWGAEYGGGVLAVQIRDLREAFGGGGGGDYGWH